MAIGTTPTLQLPYPEPGTGEPANGAAQIKALALAMEAALPPAVADALADDPGLRDALIDRIGDITLDDLNIAKSLPSDAEDADDEAFIGDEAGRPSKVGFDRYGEIAEATMRSAEGKGMPRVATDDSAGDGGFHLTDSEGNRFALGFDGTGQFDLVTKWALVNLLGIYGHADEPMVWPGHEVLWVRVEDGELVVRRRTAPPT
jgi:hypothetical protein